MELLAIGLATLIIVLWFVILLAWLMTFGMTLRSEDVLPESLWLWQGSADRPLGIDEPLPAQAGPRPGA